MIDDWDAEILFARLDRRYRETDLDRDPIGHAEFNRLKSQLSSHLERTYGRDTYTAVSREIQDRNMDEAYDILHERTTV